MSKPKILIYLDLRQLLSTAHDRSNGVYILNHKIELLNQLRLQRARFVYIHGPADPMQSHKQTALSQLFHPMQWFGFKGQILHRMPPRTRRQWNNIGYTWQNHTLLETISRHLAGYKVPHIWTLLTTEAINDPHVVYVDSVVGLSPADITAAHAKIRELDDAFQEQP